VSATFKPDLSIALDFDLIFELSLNVSSCEQVSGFISLVSNLVELAPKVVIIFTIPHEVAVICQSDQINSSALFITAA
jgi:hypothetical protein